MKVFLFLYPIKFYVACETSEPKEQSICLQRLNEIIEHRFRSQGFQVYWLLFGQEGNEAEPDTRLVEPLMDIRPYDVILSAGISLKEHLLEGVYPCPAAVIERLSKPKQLAVGGFHLTDCVSRVAACAYASGIPTFVDEDATDILFWLRHWVEIPPVSRTRQEYAVDNRKMLKNMSEYFQVEVLYEKILELQRVKRSFQPWLIMV